MKQQQEKHLFLILMSILSAKIFFPNINLMWTKAEGVCKWNFIEFISTAAINYSVCSLKTSFGKWHFEKALRNDWEKDGDKEQCLKGGIKFLNVLNWPVKTLSYSGNLGNVMRTWIAARLGELPTLPRIGILSSIWCISFLKCLVLILVK